MPAAAQSSLLSSLRHAFHPSSHQNPSAVAPDPPTAASSFAIDRHSLQPYQAFESQLSQRLSSLSPADDSPCACISSLNRFLQVLLATQADLGSLLPVPRRPLCQAQIGRMTEFLERSIKLLDLCRVIKEQISVAESLQRLLRGVLSCLSDKNGGLSRPRHVFRARKMLAELLLRMEAERGEEPPVCTIRSFQFRCRGHVSGLSEHEGPRRWHSWRGCSSMSASSSPSPSPLPLVSNLSDMNVSRQLQAALSTLAPPKLPAADMEDLFSAAIYAVDVTAIFFLATVSASLPSPDRPHVPSFAPPPSLSWAHPLLRLQERVQEEVKGRSRKSNSYAGMWELHHIATIVRRLFDLTQDDDSAKEEEGKNERKNLVKQLKQHAEELDRDMGHLYSQIMGFYNGIISARMDVLDKLAAC